MQCRMSGRRPRRRTVGYRVSVAAVRWMGKGIVRGWTLWRMLQVRWGAECNGPVAGGHMTSGFGALAVHAATVRAARTTRGIRSWLYDSGRWRSFCNTDPACIPLDFLTIQRRLALWLQARGLSLDDHHVIYEKGLYSWNDASCEDPPFCLP